MVKRWMLAFVVVAILSGVAGVSFGIPAAVTLSVLCLVVAGLLLIGRIFERTASA